MHRRTLIAALAVVVALHGATAFAEEESRESLKKRLDSRFAPPEWLAQTNVPFTDAELTESNKWGLTIWSKLADSEGNSASFKQAIATVHRTLELVTEPPFKAKCHQTLGYYYEGMLDDCVLGFQCYRELFRMADAVKEVHDPQNHNFRDTRRLGVLGMARCYAKLGLTNDARKLLEKHSFSDWRELLDLAVIYQLMKDAKRSEAAIVAAASAGQGDPMRSVAALGRSIILLNANGNTERVRKLLPDYFRAYDALKASKPDLPSNLVGENALLQTIRKNIEAKAKINPASLPDGRYSGKSVGFNAPIEVTVSIKAGKITEVNVLRMDEKRCFNAGDSIPKQIAGRQSLDVDAVTGATVTSQAIAEAVRDALSKAEQ